MPIILSNSDNVLTASAQIILSSSISTASTMTRATITNHDTVTHNVTVYRVFSGETPTDDDIIISPNGYPGEIKAGETQALPLTGHSLVNGQAFYAMADTTDVVNISISYVQQN